MTASPPKSARLAWVVLLALVVAPFCGALAVRSLEARFGLTGTYFAHPDWQPPLFSVHDPNISTGYLRRRFEVFGDNPFSVTWRGFLAVPKNGLYTFTILSDGGSTLLVDGLLIDNRGSHGPQARSRAMALRSGFHPIELNYQKTGGGFTLELFWGLDGQPVVNVPRTALLNRKTYWGVYGLARWTQQSLLPVPFAWIGLCEVWVIRRFWRRFVGASTPRHAAIFVAVLAGSTLLNLVGSTWGMPGPGTWSADEIMPSDVSTAASQLFSGGWWTGTRRFSLGCLPWSMRRSVCWLLSRATTPTTTPSSYGSTALWWFTWGY